MAGEQVRISPLGGVKAFNCRNCGGQVNLLAPGQTIAAVCQHCKAVTDLTDENFKILSRYNSQMVRQPRYEIGSKAVFEGKTWVVIGYMVRIVQLYSFEWEEYLLFNPYHGFRFLAHSYGHWSWIKMVHDSPLIAGRPDQLVYKDRKYKFLTDGEAEVLFVLGEFYWRVKVGDTAKTRDLVAPPYMLSVEYERDGMIWSLGEYVEPNRVEAAFGGPPKPKISRVGVGANQPNRYHENFRRLLPIWIISMVVTIAIFFAYGATAPDLKVHDGIYAFPNAVDVVSPPFEIGNGINNVEVDLMANSGLDNHWVEFSGVLHNLETNENYEFTVGAEYYHGVTDGESWSEGSSYGDATLNEVPAGKYEMVVASESDSAGSVTLTVRRGVPIYTNTLIVLILLSIVPVLLKVLDKNFEKRRNA
jgi:hypothetical protein